MQLNTATVPFASLPTIEEAPDILYSDGASIYIAGPMRGYPDFNFPAFYAAEDKLQALGWTVGNPARMDDEAANDVRVMPGNAGIREAMKRDLVWIASNADAIYMLEGWEASAGANAEWTLAKTLGIPIFYQMTI